MASVSPTLGLIFSGGMASTSAACIAIVVRVPLRSGDPVIRLTVPSALTPMVQYFQAKRDGQPRVVYVFNRTRTGLVMLQMAREIAREYGIKVPDVWIPEAAAIQESGMLGVPIHVYAPHHKAVDEIRKLARKVIK